MRRSATLLFHWLHAVALSAWLGGILAIGGIAAPAVFRTARAQGGDDSPFVRFAGEALGEAFARLNWVALGAGLLALISGLLYARLGGLCPFRATVRAGLTSLALGLAAYLTFSLYPALIAARYVEPATFDTLHRTYSNLSLAEAVLLVGVLGLTGWMHLGGGGDHLGQKPQAPTST